MSKEMSLPGADSENRLFQAIAAVIGEARVHTRQAVNSAMVQAYWRIGRLIVEHEQRGEARAAYGKQQLTALSRRLTTQFGKGFDASNLRNMRSFYLCFAKRDAARLKLSWTHYRILIRIEDRKARSWYEKEAIEQHWSTRALERQISKLYYERLLSSRDPEPLRSEAEQKLNELATAQRPHPKQVLRDPYIFDFLNLPDRQLHESDIERSLLDNLQAFLLELGKGFAFVARQQRLRTEDQDFYVNLSLYTV